MSTIEALRVQMDTLRLELQQVQVENAHLRDENARLRGENPQEAARIDSERENEALTDTEIQELRQLTHDAQESEARAGQEAQAASERLVALERQIQERAGDYDEIEQLKACCAELESCCHQLELEAEQRCDRAELEWYRALEAERQKWEAREERLLEQLRKVEGPQRLGVSPVPAAQQEAESLSDAGRSGGVGKSGATVSQGEHSSSPRGSGSASPGPSKESVGLSPNLVEQPKQQKGVDFQSALSTALLAQQLPPIGKFDGDVQKEGDG